MDFTSCNYFICLIDVMGQKKFFESIRSADVGAKVQDDIVRVSDGLREMIRYVKNRYDRLFEKEDDAGIELFSDSLLLSLKDRGADNVRLSAWFEIIMKVIFIACKHKMPFRGSIVKGAAHRSKGGMIYGVAVDEAMELEQSRADSFRVILSNTLAHELVMDNGFDNEKYLELDTDCAMVLNYAGPRILVMTEFARERQRLHEIADWVLERFRYFCYDGTAEHDKHANPKLARRFKIWGEYLALEASKETIATYVRNI